MESHASVRTARVGFLDVATGIPGGGRGGAERGVGRGENEREEHGVAVAAVTGWPEDEGVWIVNR